MIPVTIMRGRDVALFGLGGSGMATARALREGGANAIVWDDNPGRVEAALGEGFEAADLREADWSRFAALVVAPGVPLTHPKPHWTVDLAHSASIEVIGDIELFCRERAAICPEAPFVAITGTNGKSTTTALIAHLLREVGRNVQMGGNIGVPILELEPPSPDRVHVVECSSYQIDLAPSLNPSVGVLLNITPDHLDRHGTFENYAAIKTRLVAESDVAVIVCDGETERQIAKHLQLGSVVRSVSTTWDWNRPRVEGPDACDDDSYLSIVNTNNRSVWKRHWGRNGRMAPNALKGPHNEQNVLAALLTCRELGVDLDSASNALDSFPGLAHRMEPLAESSSALFVNDSKATNAASTYWALSSFSGERTLHWIAGGLAKDGGIESLRPLFGHVERAYLIGEAAPQFAATLGDTVPYEISGTLDVAVAHAARDAREAGGGVVLFSPAAASFDQFRNFEERGEAFRRAVAALGD